MYACFSLDDGYCFGEDDGVFFLPKNGLTKGYEFAFVLTDLLLCGEQTFELLLYGFGTYPGGEECLFFGRGWGVVHCLVVSGFWVSGFLGSRFLVFGCFLI